MWLWGAPATGKTHLLLATVRAATDGGLSSAYMPAHAGFKPDALDALRRIELLCIDDADRLAGVPEVEEAMGGLCRELERRGARLVLAASSTPAGAGYRRDDMRTRLTSGQIWKLRPLTDEERLEAVQLRVRSRGIALPEATARFLCGASGAIPATFSFWWTAWPHWPRPAANSSPCPSCALHCAKAWFRPAPDLSRRPRVRPAAPPAGPRAAGRQAGRGGR